MIAEAYGLSLLYGLWPVIALAVLLGLLAGIAEARDRRWR